MSSRRATSGWYTRMTSKRRASKGSEWCLCQRMAESKEVCIKRDPVLGRCRLPFLRGIDQAARMQSQYPQSAQSRTSAAYVSCQPRTAPPQHSRWGGEPALIPVAGRVPRVLALGPPHARRGRVASSILLRARGSCESRVPGLSLVDDFFKGPSSNRASKCTLTLHLRNSRPTSTFRA